MEKKQVTREHLTLLLAKFIKDSQKNMGDKTENGRQLKAITSYYDGRVIGWIDVTPNK